MGQARRELKRLAGERAAGLVEPGMRVGLGSGSTAEEFIRALGSRVADGLQITAVASSLTTADLARSLGIELVEHDGPLDLAVDGADAVERGSLAAIKGLGGALVREKLVAIAAARYVLIIDGSKLFEQLADSHDHVPLPVEVLPFGATLTRERLQAFGEPRLRLAASDNPYMSDNGNLIFDLHGVDYQHPMELDQRIKGLSGVVDHGLFYGLASQVIIAAVTGVEVLESA